jgi:hypothetical protein
MRAPASLKEGFIETDFQFSKRTIARWRGRRLADNAVKNY